MSNSDNPLEDRRKAQEEDYFRKQNEAAKQKLAAKESLKTLGIEESELQNQLMDAGFNGDSARSVFLVPLIEVAWADGILQDEERRAVLKLMKERGIEEGSEAYRCAESWMAAQPSDAKYLAAKSLLEPFMNELKKSGRANPDELISAAEEVAKATGGLFGFGWNMISSEEKAVLQKLTRSLKS